MNFDEKILQDFPHNKIYMNNASVSMMPMPCITKMKNFLVTYNNIGPDSKESETLLAEELAKTRKAISKLLHCATNKIILTQSTTDGVNITSNGLSFKSKSNIILRGSNHEHHANYYPWLKLSPRIQIRNLEINENGFFDLTNFYNNIDNNTELVVLSHALYNTGSIMPIDKIGRILDEKHIPYFIDAAQTIGCLDEFNVNKCKCTFASFNGSKWLCGPMGTGIFYCGKPNLLLPTDVGGESAILFKNKLVYKDIPNKFQTGFRNYVGAVGLNESINYLLEIGLNKIRNIVIKLSNILRNELLKIKNVTIYGPADPNMRTSIVSFNLNDVDPHLVVNRLDKKKIVIAVREIYNKKIIRISPHFFNTEDEIMTVVNEIKRIAMTT